MVIFETDRLIVRRLMVGDAPLVFEYSQEQCTRDELPDEVFDSLEEATDRIRILSVSYECKSYPLVYAVALKESGLLIGHVSLSAIEDGKVEIGYAIATAHQRKGYATELIRPFAQWAKNNLGINAIYGIVKSSNTASWKCLEQAGFILQKEETCYFLGKTCSVRTYLF